jgi:uncharacterized protein (TIGR00297 family)
LQVAAFPPTHDIVASLFAVKNVPLWQAFAINVVLFSTFSSKLLKSLTSEGFAHAMVLGTLLWATLGFRGWLVCVSYLIFGSVVTKIRFEEKEAAGIAEARGGRRGPENVWYVCESLIGMKLRKIVYNIASYISAFWNFTHCC